MTSTAPADVKVDGKWKAWVQTPVGPGTLAAVVIGESGQYLQTAGVHYMVDFGKRFFSEESWRKIVGATGALSATQIFPESELIPLDVPPKPVTAVRRPRPVTPSITADDITRQDLRASGVNEDIAIGQVWVSKKAGDRYEITDVTGSDIHLNWLDGKYTRRTSMKGLIRNYTKA